MTKRGMTLIELLVVVAVIGIFAAISIPAYLDYTIRTRVSEGLNLASGAKLAVSETALSNNALPANQAETGYVSPPPTENVQSIAIANDGSARITVTYRAKAGGGTIVLTPRLSGNELIWSCAGGTLRSSFRPAECR